MPGPDKQYYAGMSDEFENWNPMAPVPVKSSIPEPSLSGPSRLFGMGGTEMPSPRQNASRGQSRPKERALTPEELMALADQMQNQLHAEHMARMAQGPAVHVQDDTEIPDWLQQDAVSRGYDKMDYTKKDSPDRKSIVDSNKYLNASEKKKYY